MKLLFIIISCILTLIIINFFFRKFNFLLDIKKIPHKSFASKDTVPLTGGFILVIILFFLDYNNIYLIFFLLIFFLGVFADLYIIVSPLKKLIFQFIIVFFSLYLLEINIITTKIFFIDYFIENKIFSILFSTFCLLILINGTNFIDGINTLVVGYYILIFSVILYIGTKNSLLYSFNNNYYLFFCLLVIYIFNFFSKNYLGDSGSFLLAFVTGLNLISLCNDNLNLSKPVSPIFILLLLWYPAFENLFSIIRRLTNKINLSNPDNFHLHHLLFMFIKRYFNNKIANKYINSLTGTIINFYNSIIFILASQIYFYTNYLSYLVLLNIFIYLFSYYFLIKYRSKF